MGVVVSEEKVKSQAKKPNEEKWGDALRQGFVIVPWVLLRRQKELGLDSLKLVVLLHLLASWWEVNKAPFPRSSTLANRMDVSTRTVQRCLRALEKQGYLARRHEETGRSTKTLYDLTPLATTLQEVVRQSIMVAQAEAQAPQRGNAVEMV